MKSEIPNRPAARRAPLWAIAGMGLLAVAAPAGLIVLLVSDKLAARSASVAPVVSPNTPAPGFRLRAQDGRTFHLADYKGRAVFLAFVPSLSDTDSIAEARALARTNGEFDKAGAKTFLVAPDSATTASALHTREKLPYPILTDTNGALARTYGAVGPRKRLTFVVDPAGKVKFRVSMIDAKTHGKQLLDISKCCVDEVRAARASGVGKTVGDYSLPLAGDKNAMATVFGDNRQKATAVLFLSAKCPCSNSYNTRIAALARAYASQKVRVVGVYANHDETDTEIAQHARAHGFTFPVLRDDRGLCADHFKASVTPEAFVLDAQHVLRYQGRLDDSREAAEAKTHELTDALEAVAANKPAPASLAAFGCGIVR